MTGRWRLESAGRKDGPERGDNVCKGVDLTKENQGRNANALEVTSGWGWRSGRSQIR